MTWGNRIRILGIAAVAVTLTWQPAGAQDQPVVFAHGLNSSGNTWTTMRSTLESQLQIAGLSPTLGWGSSYATQADNLHASLQGLSNVIAVTHSNGGVLTRRYLTANGSPLVNRHVSINSPHTGAPLAQNALNGNLPAWALQIYSALYNPFAFYGAEDPYFMGGIWNYTVTQLLLSIGHIDLVAAAIGYVSQGPFPSVLPEMVPGSTILQAQLSPSALLTEAQRAGQRISVSSELNLNGQPYSVFWQDPSAMETAVLALTFFAVDQYDHYYWHDDPFLQAYAPAWLILAGTLAWIPADWSAMIGAYVDAIPVGYAVYYWATLNDGIVPWDRSAYPGGSGQANMPRSTYGDIGHTSQTTNGTMLTHIRDLLQVQFGVPLRPPPFIASISGATVVPPYATCNYAASVSGGSPPYTFEWYAGNSLVGTSQSLSLFVSPPGPELSLVVRDATNATTTASRQLTTDSYSSGCF